MAARVFHAPLIAAVPDLRLAAVASSRPAEVQADLGPVPVHPEMAALLTDPAVELVVLATPTESHAPLAAQALRAGRHVLVDKPFALDFGEADGLAALARQVGRQLHVFHNRRFDSDFLGLKAAITDGRIGTVTHFVSRIDRYRPDLRDRWREDGSPGSGLWRDLAPHLIDQALALFGMPESVGAELAALRPGGIADDWAQVTLRWPRRRAVLGTTLLAAAPAPRFVVHGTDGSLTKQGADLQEAQLVAGLRPGDAGWGHDPDPLVITAADGSASETPVPDGCQEQFYAGLAASLRRGDDGGALDAALAVQRVFDASLKAAASGASVRL